MGRFRSLMSLLAIATIPASAASIASTESDGALTQAPQFDAVLAPEGGIAVNRASDEPDADPAVFVCDVDLATPGHQCTLRAAIQTLNLYPFSSGIHIGIRDGNGNPVPGIPTIRPTSPLPPITNGGGIAAGQGAFVEIDGSLAGRTANGLEISAALPVTLLGLVINRFGGAGVLIRGGNGHRLQRNRIGYTANGAALGLNGTGAVRIEDGAGAAPQDVTLGAGPADPDASINLLGGGVIVTGASTRRVRLLRNVLEVPPEYLDNAQQLRLPFDLSDDGPSCAPWLPTSDPGPNDRMPPPRVTRLPSAAGGAIEGITRPGATVVAYRATHAGTNEARYWARRVEPIGIVAADAAGAFAIVPSVALALGDHVSLHATDSAGNSSELTQLRRPLIFLPGIGGTWLRSAQAEDVWLPIASGSDAKNERMVRLAMTPNGDASIEPLAADEVLEGLGPARIVYGPVHDHLQAAGFPGHPFNANQATLDQWRFPNDWRFGVDVLANDLRVLIDRLTTDSATTGTVARSCEVDLVAHSNGGMISSIYLRRDADHARDRVHRFVTSGTPFLGSTQAVAAHSNGYIFGADEALGSGLVGTALGGWDVAWGDMLGMIRNVPGAYGLMPSRAYYDTADPTSLSHRHGYAVVDLENVPRVGYDATFAWFTAPKVVDGLPNGLARNAGIWQVQQAQIHAVMNDWRDYQGPPQVFRHVGLLVAATETGWFLGTGPDQIAASPQVRRSEAGDTDRHRAFRERLRPIWGVGDMTVPLLSATLGRSPLVGQFDLSGVDESPWVEEFEYYQCAHGALVEADCRPLGGVGEDALDRLVSILKSGYEVQAAVVQAAAAALGNGPQAEVFYIEANAPIDVILSDAQGRRTGPIDPLVPQHIAYEVPGVAYQASRLGATLSVPIGESHAVDVIARSPGVTVRLTRQRAGDDAVTQILYADQPLPQNGRLSFALAAGPTPETSPWQRDADGDGTPEAVVPAEVVLAGNAAVPALPIPQPSVIDRVAPTGAPPQVILLNLPDTGTGGWTFALAESAPWLGLSQTIGSAPIAIDVTLDPTGLPEGTTVATTLVATLNNGSFTTTIDVPVRLRIAPPLDNLFANGFE